MITAALVVSFVFSVLATRWAFLERRRFAELREACSLALDEDGNPKWRQATEAQLAATDAAVTAGRHGRTLRGATGGALAVLALGLVLRALGVS
jgi:hypothetical protein